MGDKGGGGGKSGSGGGGGDKGGGGGKSGRGGGDLGVGSDQFGLGGDSGGGSSGLGVGSDQFGLGGGGDSSFVDTSGGSGGVVDNSLSGTDQGSVDTSGGTLGGSTLADLAAAISGGGFDTGGLGGGFGPQSAGFDAPAGAAPLDGSGGAGLDITPGGTIQGAGLSDLMQAITGGDNLAGGFGPQSGGFDTGKGGGFGSGTGAGTGGIPGVDAGTGGIAGAGLNDLMSAITGGGNLAGGFGPQSAGFNANFGASPMNLGGGGGGGGGSALSDLAAAVAGGNIFGGGPLGGGQAPSTPSSPFGVDPNSGLPAVPPDVVGGTGSAPDILAQKALTAGDPQAQQQAQAQTQAAGGQLSGQSPSFFDRLMQAVTGVSPAEAAEAPQQNIPTAVKTVPTDTSRGPLGALVPGVSDQEQQSRALQTQGIDSTDPNFYPDFQSTSTGYPTQFNPTLSPSGDAGDIPTTQQFDPRLPAGGGARPDAVTGGDLSDLNSGALTPGFGQGAPQFGGIASGTPQPFQDYGTNLRNYNDSSLPGFEGFGSTPPGAPSPAPTPSPSPRIDPSLEGGTGGVPADPDTFAPQPFAPGTTIPGTGSFAPGAFPPSVFTPSGKTITDDQTPPGGAPTPPVPAPDIPTPRERPPGAGQTPDETPAPDETPPGATPVVPLPTPRPPGADQQPAPDLPPPGDVPSLPPGGDVPAPQQPAPQAPQAPQQQAAQDAQETITGVPRRETPQGRRQGSGIAGAVANLLGIGGSPQTGRQGSLHDTIANAMGGGSLGNFVASAILQAGVPAAIALLSRGRGGGGFQLTGAPAAMGALGRGTAAAAPQFSRNLFPGSGLMVPLVAGQILDRSGGQSGQADQNQQGGAGYPYQRSPPAPPREPRPPGPVQGPPQVTYTGGAGATMPVPRQVVTPPRQPDVQSLVQRGQVSPTIGWIAQRGGHTQGTGAPQLQPEFASRLAAAGQAYERETGRKAQFGETGRSYDVQAGYYNKFRSGTGGLAAPPGTSRHEIGQATDIPDGPFQNWMHRNAARFGIQGLRDPRDPNHFQLDRSYTGPQYASM
jgi:hypothetical protein